MIFLKFRLIEVEETSTSVPIVFSSEYTNPQVNIRTLKVDTAGVCGSGKIWRN